MNEEERWAIQGSDLQFYDANTPNILCVLDIDLISSLDILNLALSFPLFVSLHSIVVALKLFFLAIELLATYHSSHSVVYLKVGTDL